MKAFIVLAAVVAAVAADADPQLYVAGKPCTNAYGAAVPCAQGHPVFANTYAAYGAYSPFYHALGKREAEADADAQIVTPYGGYAAGYGVPAFGYHAPAFYGVGLVAKPCTNDKGEAVECAHGTHANVYAVPTVHSLGKRDADAAYAFTGYSQFPLRGYHPYASHGLTHTSQLGFCTNYLGQAVPC